MVQKNGRLVGYLLVLGLVLITLWYFHQAAQQVPPAESMRDMPGLGQVPTDQQIHGSGPPPPAPRKK